MIVKKFILGLLLSLILSVSGFCQVSDESLNLTLDQNIQQPEVPRRAKEYVRLHIDQLRRNLSKSGFNPTLVREDDVIKMTLLCDSLFYPGSVEIKPSALELLRKLGLVVREPSRYKVLVAVHTDDTGDEMYSDSISASRANAIDDALWVIAGEKDTNVIPYGIGKDNFILKNSSRANRSKNRRVEIYIVPDDGLIELSGVKRKTKTHK